MSTLMLDVRSAHVVEAFEEAINQIIKKYPQTARYRPVSYERLSQGLNKIVYRLTVKGQGAFIRSFLYVCRWHDLADDRRVTSSGREISIPLVLSRHRIIKAVRPLIKLTPSDIKGMNSESHFMRLCEQLIARGQVQSCIQADPLSDQGGVDFFVKIDSETVPVQIKSSFGFRDTFIADHKGKKIFVFVMRYDTKPGHFVNGVRTFLGLANNQYVATPRPKGVVFRKGKCVKSLYR